jgi:hypothetical protein
MLSQNTLQLGREHMTKSQPVRCLDFEWGVMGLTELKRTLWQHRGFIKIGFGGAALRQQQGPMKQCGHQQW